MSKLLAFTLVALVGCAARSAPPTLSHSAPAAPQAEYALVPLATEADWAPATFSVVASSTDADGTRYGATWHFAWSDVQRAFVTGAPEVQREERGPCLPCNDTVSG